MWILRGEEVRLYDLYPQMGISDVSFAECGVRLACAVCVGVDLCVSHHDVLENPEWEDDKKQEVIQRLDRRVKRLGYTPASPKYTFF